MTSSPCNLPLQTQKSRPPHQTVRRTAAEQWCRHSALFPLQHPIGACPDYTRAVCVCVCVFFPFILDIIKFVGRTSQRYFNYNN